MTTVDVAAGGLAGKSPGLHEDRPGPRAFSAPKVLALLLILAVGVALRVRINLDYDGLAHDDALLCSNVLRFDEWRLLRPLELAQAAPIGHLLLMKEAVRIGGTGERILRLPSLVASILALVLSPWLFSRITRPSGTIAAAGLLASSLMTILYAGTAKQYSGDVLAAVVLLAVGLGALRAPAGAGRFAWMGAVGVVSIFFSQSSVFLLGGIGLTLIASALLDRKPGEAAAWVAVSAAWLGVFLALYLLIYKAYAADAYFASWWSESFAPFPPRSVSDLKWYSDTFFAMFWDCLGVKFAGLASVLFLAGAVHLYRQGRGREVSMLLLPVLLTLAASALRKYPFGDRLILFMGPILAALIGAGLTSLIDVPGRTARTFLVLASAILFFHPAYLSVKQLAGGFPVQQDIKPALAYVSDHVLPGDEIFLEFDATEMTDYYRDVINYKDTQRLQFIHGQFAGGGAGLEQELAFHEKILDRLRGKKRVWFIFAMNHTIMEPKFTLLLNRIGVQLDAFHSDGSSALLYDLSRTKADEAAPGPVEPPKPPAPPA